MQNHLHMHIGENCRFRSSRGQGHEPFHHIRIEPTPHGYVSLGEFLELSLVQSRASIIREHPPIGFPGQISAIIQITIASPELSV